MPNPIIPGKLIFAFSYDEKGERGERRYHIIYNQSEDLYKDRSQLAGGLYKLMSENPWLIEEFILVSHVAADDLSKLIKDTYK
jgi:hypothetical protein